MDDFKIRMGLPPFPDSPGAEASPSGREPGSGAYKLARSRPTPTTPPVPATPSAAESGWSKKSGVFEVPLGEGADPAKLEKLKAVLAKPPSGESSRGGTTSVTNRPWQGEDITEDENAIRVFLEAKAERYKKAYPDRSVIKALEQIKTISTPKNDGSPKNISSIDYKSAEPLNFDQVLFLTKHLIDNFGKRNDLVTLPELKKTTYELFMSALLYLFLKKGYSLLDNALVRASQYTKRQSYSLSTRVKYIAIDENKLSLTTKASEEKLRHSAEALIADVLSMAIDKMKREMPK